MDPAGDSRLSPELRAFQRCFVAFVFAIPGVLVVAAGCTADAADVGCNGEEGDGMKIIIYIKDSAEVDRIADYLTRLPPKREFEDVIDRLEKVDDEGSS